LFSTLRQKIMLGVAIQLLPLLMLAGAGYFFFQKTSTLFDATWDEVFSKMMPIVHLNDELHRVAMPVNDYLITGDPAEQASYLSRAEIVDREFRALLDKWQSNGDSPRGSETIRAAQEQWEVAKGLAGRIFALPDGGRSPLVSKLMRRFDFRVYAAIEQLAALHRQVHVALEQQRQRVKGDRQKVKYLIMVMIISAVLVSLLMVWFFFRRILAPLQIIEQGAEAFGAGKFSYRIRLDTEDELGRLVRVFNEMADRLEEVATRDSLTGLYNKKEILRLLEVELGRAQRQQTRLCLMMLDLDYFKQINDTYGHQVGDMALRRTAELLTKNVRGIDHVGRYGGEEFCIVLPETSVTEAVEIAERIRRNLEEELIHPGNGAVIRLATSIGIAVFPEDATEGKKLVACADAALYRAKSEGRNRVKKYSDLV
jgi:diguanylate cyclase (GGDEF)-like protein